MHKSLFVFICLQIHNLSVLILGISKNPTVGVFACERSITWIWWWSVQKLYIFQLVCDFQKYTLNQPKIVKDEAGFYIHKLILLPQALEDATLVNILFLTK